METPYSNDEVVKIGRRDRTGLGTALAIATLRFICFAFHKIHSQSPVRRDGLLCFHQLAVVSWSQDRYGPGPWQGVAGMGISA